MHALSSSLKAYCTTRTVKAIETCRLACGGHGFSEASGLPKLFSYAAAPATAEGEATVLLLQNARYNARILPSLYFSIKTYICLISRRYLMKCYEHAKSGSAMDTFSDYMVQKSCPRFSGNLSIDSLIEALAFRAKRFTFVSRFVPCYFSVVVTEWLNVLPMN